MKLLAGFGRHRVFAKLMREGYTRGLPDTKCDQGLNAIFGQLHWVGDGLDSRVLINAVTGDL